MEKQTQITPATKRLLFIDIMRGLAVIWMIEAHITHAVMDPAWKDNFLWNLIAVSNGFVAVTFLFCAGAGFWLASNKKFDDYKQFNAPFVNHLKKILLILFTGYWLHLPIPSFTKFLQMPNADWLRFLEADVLQNIAVSSLIAIFLMVSLPKLKHLSIASLILTLLMFTLAPIIWQMNLYEKMPFVIGAYFAHLPISKFPIFHWSGYFFAGIFFSHFFMNYKNKEKLAVILIVSTIAIITLLLTTNHLHPLYGWQVWWDCHPGHNFFRLSGAVLIFASLFLLEKIIPPKIAKFMSMAGQESLFIYVFHLMLVYGSVLNVGLSYFMPQNQNLISTISLYLAVTSITLMIANYWHKLKKEKPKYAKVIFRVLFWGFLLKFFISKY